MNEERMKNERKTVKNDVGINYGSASTSFFLLSPSSH